MSIAQHLLTKRAVEYALLWCSLRYGPSIWTNTGRIQVLTNRSLNCMGRYWVNDDGGGTIIVNLSLHKSLIELVDTVIHEYIHHKQPIELEYQRYFDNGFTHDNHPFEIEATKIAARDARECRNWVYLRIKQ